MPPEYLPFQSSEVIHLEFSPVNYDSPFPFPPFQMNSPVYSLIYTLLSGDCEKCSFMLALYMRSTLFITKEHAMNAGN